VPDVLTANERLADGLTTSGIADYIAQMVEPLPDGKNEITNEVIRYSVISFFRAFCLVAVMGEDLC